ncbi:MAG: hypothetical protein LBL62_12130, partial [Planctomycetaceae bacterium]|nr:hypothetical protein [Planctomycetaceae bacterium]
RKATQFAIVNQRHCLKSCPQSPSNTANCHLAMAYCQTAMAYCQTAMTYCQMAMAYCQTAMTYCQTAMAYCQTAISGFFTSECSKKRIICPKFEK